MRGENENQGHRQDDHQPIALADVVKRPNTHRNPESKKKGPERSDNHAGNRAYCVNQSGDMQLSVSRDIAARSGAAPAQNYEDYSVIARENQKADSLRKRKKRLTYFVLGVL